MILGQIIAVMIMFMATVFVAALFFIPILSFKRNNRLVNFYWVGFWIFLAIITSLSGAGNTLMLIGDTGYGVSDIYTKLTLIAFIAFVMFGWVHISSRYAFKALKRLIA